MTSEISRFVKDARKSKNFDFEKTLELINANDQDGLIKLLLNLAKETFPFYSVPPYTEHNLILIIREEINKTYDNPACVCDKYLSNDKCNSKTCGCNCDRCVLLLSYPCITCGIAFFCGQPCVCSNCKILITNESIANQQRSP